MTNIEQLEEKIYLFKHEKDSRKKHILYLNLVEESLKLVNKIVSSMYPIPVTVSKDDLIQVGAIGVLKAIDTYEIKDKGSFKTYVSKFIKGKILQYLRDKASIVKTPRETAENINKVKNYIENINTQVMPSVKDIATALKMPENRVYDILNTELIKNTISLDQNYYSTDGVETLADRLQAVEDREYETNYENKKLIEFALQKLPKDEKTAIYKYYIEEETKKSIAQILGVSQTHVARLIKRALNKMYYIISEEGEK